MSFHLNPFARRRFLQGIAAGSVLVSAPGAFADELLRTPEQTEGPFYPDRLPLDTDNDLLILNDSTTSAVGDVTHLGGRILDINGTPLRNAVIEIWQADNGGAYIHSRSAQKDKADSHFQGFGRFLTGSNGEYYFRTIKPVPYPGRSPHIHFAVYHNNRRILTTQCYINGHEMNARDGVLRGIRDPKLKDLVMVDFKPMTTDKSGKDLKIAQYNAKFDIIVGATPDDPDHAPGE